MTKFSISQESEYDSGPDVIFESDSEDEAEGKKSGARFEGAAAGGAEAEQPRGARHVQQLPRVLHHKVPALEAPRGHHPAPLARELCDLRER